MQNLIKRYIWEKNHPPQHVNELLDFIQKEYIQGKVTIVEYRNAYKFLDSCGAHKPYDFRTGGENEDVEYSPSPMLNV